MRKLLIMVFVLGFVGVSSAQTVPDYRDSSRWTNIPCEEGFMRPSDRSYFLLHEDFKSVNAGEGTGLPALMLVYQGVQESTFDDKMTQADAIRRLNPQPFLLLHFYLPVDGNEPLTDIFHYINGSWVSVTGAKPLPTSQVQQFLRANFIK